uniref:Uncharacterized protein n=1 Tax=Klebsiella pneumoniae TaxID=573 RepID=A0A8B0SV31_KLEPN|nr:hypothetical protein [Klebsiella pneumoniae]
MKGKLLGIFKKSGNGHMGFFLQDDQLRWHPFSHNMLKGGNTGMLTSCPELLVMIIRKTRKKGSAICESTGERQFTVQIAAQVCGSN